MILPLERDELLSRWEGWRHFAEGPALEKPEHLSAKQIKRLGEDDRVAYDYQRERYHANFLVTTPQVKRLNVRLWDLLDANQQGPSRVKGAAVIDSPPGLGKTTAVDAFGRAFHRRQILRHGRDFDDGQTLHIPVCHVAFKGHTTTRALNEAILNFYNHPSADAAETRHLRNRNLATLAAESVRRHGTRLIIVDDVHFLKIHTDEGVALANELKWLANEYPATFLFTGVNMTDTGLLSESKTTKKLAMSQIARRWTRLALPPFAHPVDEHRKAWLSLLGTIETHLVLANAKPRMLREQADYLYERSTGMIGSLFKLITLGAVHAMRDGIEELTREVLDEIDIDVAAEDAREVVAKELEEMKRAAAKRSTSRAIA
ncbi:TniB family protein [Microbacterium sp. C448]|uniref:ATP-binding protein n=1 Tax=Microbacterium TaxID=33882 RepID=UPI0003DE3B26|nr:MULTISPECIES: ATP-binding protein [Microbacterium]CDJ99374.1 TniB family protein [Microbacterium sp. C448]